MTEVSDVQRFTNALVTAFGALDLDQVQAILLELEGAQPDLRQGVMTDLARIVSQLLRDLAEATDSDVDELRKQLLMAETIKADMLDEIIRRRRAGGEDT